MCRLDASSRYLRPQGGVNDPPLYPMIGPMREEWYPMQNAELPEEVQTVVKEFGALVVQETLALLNRLPPTLTTEIITLGELEY